MSSAVAVLVRSVVLLAAIPLAGSVFARLTGGPEANIGAGLFAFAVTVAITAGWGFLDGRRARQIGRPMRIWAAVALVTILGLWVLSVVRRDPAEEPVGPDVVIPLALFLMALVLGPALVGSAIGSAITPATPAPGPSAGPATDGDAPA